MSIFKGLFFAVLAAVVFLGTGCAGFRELFSDPGTEKKRAVRKAAKEKRKKSELRSRRYSRDPLDSLFFTDRQKRENWSKNSNLTDAEKAALRYTFDPDDTTTRQEIDRIYRESEKKRKKRQDEVFGPNPFRN
jgi:hypothetical protein